MIDRLRTIPRFNCDFPLAYAVSAASDKAIRSAGAPITHWTGGDSFWLHTGRLAAWVALRALFPDGGRRIGVQAYTCRVMFDAIRLSGNVPVFLDTDDDYTVSLPDLATKAPTLDALVLQHTFGIPARIQEVMALVGRIPVIEDCAHALFSEYDGKPTGSFGVAALFSFGLGKPVSLGGGGLLRVNAPDVARRARSVVETLAVPSLAAETRIILKALAVSLAHQRPLYGAITLPLLKRANHALDLTGNTRFTMRVGPTTTRRVLAARWEEFHRAAEVRRDHAARLADHLDGRFACRWAQDEIRRSNGYLFPLRAPRPSAVVAALRRSGFEAARHFHTALDHARRLGFEAGDCPNTERIVEEIFTVPIHQGMRLADIDRLGQLLVAIARDARTDAASHPSGTARA